MVGRGQKRTSEANSHLEKEEKKRHRKGKQKEAA